MAETSLKDPYGISFPYPLPEIKKNWLTSDVLGLAEAIFTTADWWRLAILADALLEAGCDDEYLLNHLRLSHALGQYPDLNGGCWQGTCWVVNYLLKKPQRVALSCWRTGRVSAELASRYKLIPVIYPYVPVLGSASFLVRAIMPITGGSVVTHYVIPNAVNFDDAADCLIEHPEFGPELRIPADKLHQYEDRSEVDGENRWTGFYTCTFTGDSNYPYNQENVMAARLDDLIDRWWFTAPGYASELTAMLKFTYVIPCLRCGTCEHTPDCTIELP